jgi:hypothetical protein
VPQRSATATAWHESAPRSALQMLDQLAVQPAFWLASFICAPLAALLLDFSIDQFSRLVRPRAYQVSEGLAAPRRATVMRRQAAVQLSTELASMRYSANMVLPHAG